MIIYALNAYNGGLEYISSIENYMPLIHGGFYCR